MSNAHTHSKSNVVELYRIGDYYAEKEHTPDVTLFRVVDCRTGFTVWDTAQAVGSGKLGLLTVKAVRHTLELNTRDEMERVCGIHNVMWDDIMRDDMERAFNARNEPGQ